MGFGFHLGAPPGSDVQRKLGDLLAAHLASKLCNAIPKDSKKAAELLDEALGLRNGSGGLLALAMAVDSQEQPPQEIRSRSLIWGRNPLGRPDMATVPSGGQIVLP